MKTLKMLLAQTAVVCAVGASGEVQVDTKLPAGCVIVQGVEGDTVKLELDFRTTQGGWFYWAFRVTGAEGRTLKFQFDKKYWAAVGSRGAAVSTDLGASWRWSDEIDPSAAKDELGDHADVRGFTYAFGPNDREVWFSQTLPYGLREWKAFLGEFAAERGKLFEELTLCKTKKGRDVPLVRFGRLDGKAKYRAFVSSRHHCQEASATFVVEGMMRAVMADDELGRWCCENVEFRVVPFVDLDGVVEGDQGKNRTPWDHARDYNEAKAQVHPEVSAIMKMLREWKPTYVQDTHAPWLRGSWKQKDNTNEYVYQVGNVENGAQIAAFGAVLERVQKAGLGYRAADNVPFGVGWNSGKNYTQGKTLNAWAQTDLRTASFVTTFEIPFSNQREVTLGSANLKAFGRDILTAWREYAEEDGNLVKVTFVGDAMCPGLMLAPYRTAAGGYDYTSVFAGVSNLFSQSDCVIANLETPIAPDNRDLTHERWCFCSPIEFAEALKAAGVDFVFTANNHCLDRGPEGVVRTSAALDRIGLPHTGTFATREAAARPTILDVQGVRLGLLSYTYGSNAFSNHCYLNETNRFMVNFFQAQELSDPTWKHPDNDKLPVYERVERHDRERAALKADVARMREAKPDFVVMGMHAGGQYNPAATKYTKELVGFLLGAGVDIISGTHEHVVHGSDFSRLAENKLVTYSLGNFNGVSGVWLNVAERRMSAYSIAWHVYFAKRDGAAKVVRTGFSVLKTVPGAKEGEIAVVPVADLFAREKDAVRREALRKDVLAVVQAFAGKVVETVQQEYR